MAPYNARPLLLAMIALVLFTLFFWAPSLGFGSLHYRDPPPYVVRGPSLTERVREEEMRYASTLKAREGLIKKFGPRKNQIQAYPTSGSPYTIWDFFIPSFQCPHHVERIGTLGDGGKWVCGIERIAKQEKCVIYSFGINGESSFEAAMLDRAPGCEVWGYDFSVNSFGPEIEDSPRLKERSHFFPYALGGHNAHGPENSPKYYTLDALMRLNGHTFIDVLKIDIEGAEFDTLKTFLLVHKPVSPFESTTLPIGQLQIELHAWDDYAKFEFFHGWWTALEDAGLRPFWTEANLVYVNYADSAKPKLAEYSLINIHGNHTLIHDGAEEGMFAY
jgi:hypothetical protein